MKNLPLQKSILKASGLLFTIMLLTMIVQPAFSKNTLIKKMVLYKGEWITRVDMPEINIEASRIMTDAGMPRIKNVETIYKDGRKMLHVTMEEINISGTDQIDLESTNSENKFESNQAMVNNISTNNEELIGADQNVNLNSVVNNHKYAMEESSLVRKKPFFNRIVNGFIDEGFKFLKKVNDGLFFKS